MAKKVKTKKVKETWFEVGIPQVHISWREVKAKDSEEAIAKAKDGEDEGEVEFEYSHTIDSSWQVRESNNQKG